MKRFTLCALTLLGLTYNNLFAQEYYKGVVLNSNGNGVELANVALLNSKDSTLIIGTVTNSKGQFELNSSSKGLLKISCLGYKAEYVNTESNIPLTITLQNSSTLMKEVVIRSTKPFTHIEGDALVTHIKGTPLERLGTANDVLGRLPGVMNNQGNIVVFGKGAPTIYINGRLVQHNNLLDQLKSEKIKKVEIVTNPGARYSATVKAVIRITTEREYGEGLSFANTTKIGYLDYLYGMETVNMNYRKGKLDIFTDLEYNYQKTKQTNQSVQNTYLTHLYTQNINLRGKNRNQLYDGRISFNYTFSPIHSLGVYYKISHKPNKSQLICNTNSWIDDVFDDKSSITSAIDGNSTTHNIDGYYTNNLGKWNINAAFDVLWKTANGFSHYQEVNQNTSNRDITSNIDRDARFFAGELHLMRPFWKGIIKLGTEYTNSRSKEDFVNIGNVLTNNFPLIKEGNTALYIELMQRFGQITFQVGSRYEHVNSNYYQNGQKVEQQSRRYDKLFPTALITFPLSKMNIQISYAKKYMRPLYSQLGGSVTYINRYLFESGNPFLRPTYMDEFALNVNYKWAMMMLNYTHTTNKIITSAIDYKNTEATLFKKENSKYDMNELQMLLHVAPEFGKYRPALMVGIVAPFYKELYQGKTKHFNHTITIVRFNNILLLNPTSMFTADFSWRGKGNGENTFINKTWQINLGLIKQWGKHWNTKFTVNDLFNSARKQSTTMYSGVRENFMENLSNTRSVECTVTYSFNTTRSKYKGKGAGSKEKERLQ